MKKGGCGYVSSIKSNDEMYTSTRFTVIKFNILLCISPKVDVVHSIPNSKERKFNAANNLQGDADATSSSLNIR